MFQALPDRKASIFPDSVAAGAMAKRKRSNDKQGKEKRKPEAKVDAQGYHPDAQHTHNFRGVKRYQTLLFADFIGWSLGQRTCRPLDLDVCQLHPKLLLPSVLLREQAKEEPQGDSVGSSPAS